MGPMHDPNAESKAIPHGQGESGQSGNSANRVGLYATAIFASAFLIFLIQPMVGKRILPWFGGVPAVWTLCLAFYQSTLFLGYAYAHLMIRFVNPRFQLWIHAAAVAAALVSLPVLPTMPADLQGDVDPTMQVLRLLASNVALPFLVLASTGPLVQAWFVRAHPLLSPYPLYAVSNVGSLLALFVYPFVLEPRLPLSQADTLWSYGFGATGLAVLACALPGAIGNPVPDSASTANASESNERIGVTRPVLWLLLAGTAVILLMGVTNKLCLDVASIPFLWLAPLATYLVTFILAFSSERSYRRAPYVVAVLAAYLVTRVMGNSALIVYQILAYCALLFSACMILHGELYRSRPAPRSLTAFYLCVSAGGALGGLFVGILAPMIFDDYYELQFGLGLTGFLVLAVCARDPGSVLRANGPRWRWAVVAPLAIGLAAFAVWHEMRPDPLEIHKERSFFGVLTVNDVVGGVGRQRSLTNGTTIHGLQFQDESTRRFPTAYFGRATGLGLAMTTRPQTKESRIGVIGLGVGTLAAYGREGETMRFYEIDPVVLKISGPGGYFSFVEDSKAHVEFVLGDARLSIEDEQERGIRQDYDLLVLDAFSSDSIPIHLMTREAFERYFEALAPGGLMAVHVSNRHFQLMGLVSRMAAEFGADSLQIKNRPEPKLQSGLTDWVIISRDSDQLTQLQTRIERRRRSLGLTPESVLMKRGSDAGIDAYPVWTDDYSDLLSVLRWD